MIVAVILLVLVVVAAIAVVVVNRMSGARPDQPRAGTEGPTNDVAADQGETRTADRPGDPGLEGMNPGEAGDPSAGPIADDEDHGEDRAS